MWPRVWKLQSVSSNASKLDSNRCVCTEARGKKSTPHTRNTVVDDFKAHGEPLSVQAIDGQ
eukprot:6063101-Amphidinium_carterae.1